MLTIRENKPGTQIDDIGNRKCFEYEKRLYLKLDPSDFDIFHEKKIWVFGFTEQRITSFSCPETRVRPVVLILTEENRGC